MTKKSTTKKPASVKSKATSSRPKSLKKRSNEEAFEPTKVALAVSALAASTLLLLALVATS